MVLPQGHTIYEFNYHEQVVISTDQLVETDYAGVVYVV
jgi:hypothetical protein